MEPLKTMRIRPYSNELDYAVLRALIEAKFADPNRRFYPSLGIMDYIRAFDERFTEHVRICEILVVVDAHEQVVGFANVWHDAANQIAIIEPFGTAPSHRRIGLATNLLYECMHRLRAIGVSQLYINHGGLWTLDPEPDDAMRVYGKAGFQKTRQHVRVVQGLRVRLTWVITRFLKAGNIICPRITVRSQIFPSSPLRLRVK